MLKIIHTGKEQLDFITKEILTVNSSYFLNKSKVEIAIGVCQCKYFGIERMQNNFLFWSCNK
jgi:hypothetical protein